MADSNEAIKRTGVPAEGVIAEFSASAPTEQEDLSVQGTAIEVSTPRDSHQAGEIFAFPALSNTSAEEVSQEPIVESGLPGKMTTNPVAVETTKGPGFLGGGLRRWGGDSGYPWQLVMARSGRMIGGGNGETPLAAVESKGLAIQPLYTSQPSQVVTPASKPGFSENNETGLPDWWNDLVQGTLKEFNIALLLTTRTTTELDDGLPPLGQIAMRELLRTPIATAA